MIVGVEIAPKPFEKLLEVCEKRRNIIPVMCDANQPEEYREFAADADIVYQDVAQKNQAEIIMKNIRAYLKKDGFAILVIKARSIDVVKSAKEIFENEINILRKELVVLDVVSLAPYDTDHVLVVLKKK